MSRFMFASVLGLAAFASAACVDALAGDAELAGLAKRKLVEPIAAAARRTVGMPSPQAAPRSAISPQHLYLVRSVLASLADANRTGNYSVMRDLAAPSFQAKHTPADLAQIFATARTKPIDLDPAMFLEPQLAEVVRTEPNALRIKGAFAARPERLLFAMTFEAVGGHWRLASVSIATEPVARDVAQAQ